MLPNSIRGLICDTGFWIAAFDKRDAFHEQAASMLNNLRNHVILMPWPIMYEVLGTRTVRQPHMVMSFARVLRLKVIRIDDAEYREQCLEDTVIEAAEKRALSLVDRVVRAMLADPRYRVSRFLTFNLSDYHDVCRACRIQVWPEGQRLRL